MKRGLLGIFTLFLFGMFLFPSTKVNNGIYATHKKSFISLTASSANSKRQAPVGGDSPFIRFHHGISESGVSISTPNELIVILKPANDFPEKLAGISEYLYGLSYRLPVTRVFLYSTPLRSPPLG